MNQRKLKLIHEESVSKSFISLYNPIFEFVRHGDDKNEPDCIFKDDKILLGVEVVSVYYSNEHAKIDWTFAKSIAKGEHPKESRSGAIVDPAELFLERIKKEVDKKSKKLYLGVDKTILCIEERNPLSEEKDIEYFISRIKIPNGHNFSEIFILHLVVSHEGGGYKIFKLRN